MIRRGAARWLLAAVVAGGVAVRAVDIGRTPLGVDEAESALNALSIVGTGLPRDHYAGQPMFENTLVRPWPESVEYEFRDLSYSSLGLAVYHGWLPLYAMAASFALAGVTPDPALGPDEPPRPRHDQAEIARRTLAARAPSLVFAALFIAAAWALGRAALGRDAALAAAAVAAFAWPCVRVGQQARYCSATLATSTLCCLALLRLGQRGRARDAAVLALALVALFHTHALTFAAACALAAAWLPRRLRGRPGAVPALVTLAALTALGVVPWALLTGALDTLPRVPAARDVLTLRDGLGYLGYHAPVIGLAAAGSVALALARRRAGHERLAARLALPLWLLAAWALLAVAAFLLITPAPSFYLWRSNLGLAGPTIALVATLGCAAARALRLPPLAPTLALAPALLAHTAASLRAPEPSAPPLLAAIEHLREAPIAPGARLYATPDQHMPLTFYTGLPVQSIAPVRREFLDAYPGEVVFIDAAATRYGVDPEVLLASARDAGVPLSSAEARALSRRLSLRILSEDVAARVASLAPPLEPLPPFVQEAVRRARALAGPLPGQDGLLQNPAIYRGHEAYTRRAAWQVFFYRFVDPARRASEPNFAQRALGARATVLPTGWVVYHAPARPDRRSAP